MTENDKILRMLPDERDRWLDGETTIDNAAERLREAASMDGERQDVLIDDFAAMGYGSGGEGVCSLIGEQAMPLRTRAFSQLSESIGAPARFLARMPARLQVPVINWGLSRRREEGGMLRLAGGEVRAMVSTRYAPCDHPQAMDALATALREVGLADDAEVISTATGMSLVVRTLWRRRDVPTKDGGRLSVGIDLTNGEVGNRAVGLAPVVYHASAAAACRKAVWRKRHMGSPSEMLTDLVRAIPEALLAAESLRDLALASATKTVDDAVAEAEAIRKMGLTVAQTREVVRSIMRARGIDVPSDTAEWPALLAQIENATVYDVWLAIIDSAKSGKSTDLRLTVEDVAGRYLASRR